MKWIIRLLIFSLMVFCVACQHTPESSPVIAQGDLVITEADDSTATSEWPSKYETDFTTFSELLDIRYDAEVILPDTSDFPVTLVMQRNFSDQDIYDMIEVLHPDVVLIKEPTLTKAQIANMIVELENAQDPDLAYRIEELTAQLETAPVEYKPEAFDLQDTPIGERFYAYAENDDGSYAVFYGTRGGGSFCYLRDMDYIIWREDALELGEDEEWLRPYFQDNFPFPKDAATEAAKTTMSALALADMQSAETIKMFAFDNGVVSVRGWDFTYTHWNRELPSLFTFDTVTFGGEELPLPTLCAPWETEVVLLSIDEAGVACLDIRNLIQYEKTAAENTQLMDFSALSERIQQQLGYRYRYAESRNAKIQITIREMELCSGTVVVENSLDRGMMIPAWFVTYDVFVQMDNIQYTVKETLYFSAIDGSYIEPRITNDMLE